MNKKQILIKELEKLKESFAAITTLWHEETELCDKALEPDYPFETSFDELSSEVHGWVEGAVEDLEYKFEMYEKVHYCKQPMNYIEGVPVEYYFQERKGYKILISTEIDVQDDGYDDRWVESYLVVPVKGWENEK